ncbi:NAD(P)-binding protein [Acephala macrosclerotiorum]|nr:NAD(P)-binding protein [Acephala macrosclerotiorum]
MVTAQKLVWLITGTSTGLGAALATHALKAGHTVISTARNPSKATSYQSISELGGHWVSLDVNAQNAGELMLEAVMKYGEGAIEDIDDQEAHAQLETNFFGPLRLIRSALPLLRSQKFGTIVNITSVAGIDGLTTSGLYAASKSALEGLSESLQREVSPFGIRVLLVEPGAFRTRFLAGGSTMRPKREMSEAYKETSVKATLGKFGEMDGKQRGDANKAVSVMFDVVMGEGVAKNLEKGL